MPQRLEPPPLLAPTPVPSLALPARFHRAARARTQPRALLLLGAAAALGPDARRGDRARHRSARTLDDKLRALDAEPRVAAFFGEESGRGVLGALESREVLLLKFLVAAGQEHVLGDDLDWSGVWRHELHRENGVNGGSALREALYTLAGLVWKWSSEGLTDTEMNSGEMELLRSLLKFLGDIEEFYDCIGGIIGYQITALELPSASNDRIRKPSQDKFIDFHVPDGLNLLEDTEYASQAALWGIQNWVKFIQLAALVIALV